MLRRRYREAARNREAIMLNQTVLSGTDHPELTRILLEALELEQRSRIPKSMTPDTDFRAVTNSPDNQTWCVADAEGLSILKGNNKRGKRVRLQGWVLEVDDFDGAVARIAEIDDVVSVDPPVTEGARRATFVVNGHWLVLLDAREG